MIALWKDLPPLMLYGALQACAPAASTTPAAPARASQQPAAAPREQAATFQLDPDGRAALTTLERLNMVTACEEVSPGLLRLRLGGGWDRAGAEYHLSHIYNGYASHVEAGRTVALELWQGNAKIGEYTADGLLIGPEFATPR
jgi:hypothetical protein